MLFEYGKGENERALELLGQTFDAIDYKVVWTWTRGTHAVCLALFYLFHEWLAKYYLVQIIGASDEQLDVFNEVWITMLLNSGRATKG